MAPLPSSLSPAAARFSSPLLLAREKTGAPADVSMDDGARPERPGDTPMAPAGSMYRWCTPRASDPGTRRCRQGARSSINARMWVEAEEIRRTAPCFSMETRRLSCCGQAVGWVDIAMSKMEVWERGKLGSCGRWSPLASLWWFPSIKSKLI
jgi:hypothetical protein